MRAFFIFLFYNEGFNSKMYYLFLVRFHYLLKALGAFKIMIDVWAV